MEIAELKTDGTGIEFRIGTKVARVEGDEFLPIEQNWKPRCFSEFVVPANHLVWARAESVFGFLPKYDRDAYSAYIKSVWNGIKDGRKSTRNQARIEREEKHNRVCQEWEELNRWLRRFANRMLGEKEIYAYEDGKEPRYLSKSSQACRNLLEWLRDNRQTGYEVLISNQKEIPPVQGVDRTILCVKIQTARYKEVARENFKIL